MTAVEVVRRLVYFYQLLIFAYVILSWFRPTGVVFDIYRTLALVCEPYISIFRRFMPVAQVGGAGIDFSPFVALIVLQLLIGPALVRLVEALGL